MNLATMIQEVARRQPTRPAVTCGGITKTYAEFAERTSRLGRVFRDMGLHQEDRVVLFMENCSEFLETLFACWVAGLCAVPVNAKLHPREVAHIANDCSARLLVTTPGLMEAAVRLPESVEKLSVLCAGTDQYEHLMTSDPLLPVERKAEDRAWLFYTSGTTGRPKGAILSHRNLLFMSLAYYADIDAVGPDDTKLHTAPLSHGSGIYALPHLLRGAHQVVLPGFEIGAIAEALTRYHNVTMFAVPTMLMRLVNNTGSEKIATDRLKTIYYGGAPMYVSDLQRALGLFGPRLFQIYGQGEAPMTITGLGKADHVDDGRSDLLERLGSCGYARTGVRVKVVDSEGSELPAGEVGEVVTHSDCVMQGYWNNPVANHDALRNGWLHTGDLGSMNDRGLLTLNDRSKDLIISGGTNIYPREIEEALLYQTSVVEASVVGRPHPDWGEEAVAFVVVKPGENVTIDQLDAICLDRIARFKRPRAYYFVESLPKNNYGKVLKTELRKMLRELETA